MRSQRMSSELDDQYLVFYSKNLWRNSDPLWFLVRLCLVSPPLRLDEEALCVLPPVSPVWASCRQINLLWNSAIIDSNVITQINASARLSLLFFLNLEPPSESLTCVLIRGICRRRRSRSLCSVDMERWTTDLKTNNKIFWTICQYLCLSSGFD